MVNYVLWRGYVLWLRTSVGKFDFAVTQTLKHECCRKWEKRSNDADHIHWDLRWFAEAKVAKFWIFCSARHLLNTDKLSDQLLSALSKNVRKSFGKVVKSVCIITKNIVANQPDLYVSSAWRSYPVAKETSNSRQMKSNSDVVSTVCCLLWMPKPPLNRCEEDRPTKLLCLFKSGVSNSFLFGGRMT